MKHAVVVATIRRPEVLNGLLQVLARQTVTVDQVLAVVVDPLRDLPAAVPPWVRVLVSEPGLTRQRNAAIRDLSADIDLITFLDDDVHPADDYLERVQAFAQERNDVVLFSGRVIYDGAVSGSVDRPVAERVLRDATPREGADWRIDAYGCNMNVRAPIARREMFDEHFPAYGWLEDRDFAVRCGRHGKVLTHEKALLVHLGVPSGRMPAPFLGYSQIANPMYLLRKGTLSRGEASMLALRVTVGNILGVVRSDRSVDRRGRLRGNARAAGDLVRGRLDPSRAPC